MFCILYVIACAWHFNNIFPSELDGDEQTVSDRSKCLLLK